MLELTIKKDGTEFYVDCGVYQGGDYPAVIWADGTEVWYNLGHIHREDAPAKVRPNGEEVWYNYGLHMLSKETSSHIV